MPTPRFGFVDSYFAGVAPSSVDLDRRGDFIDSQVPNAILGVGIGVVNGLAVTPGDGLDVDVASGQVNIRHADYGAVSLILNETVNVDGFPDNATRYLFVTLPDDFPRHSGGGQSVEPVFTIELTDTLLNAQLLAKVVAESGAVIVTDLRDFTSENALLFDLVGRGRIVGADTTEGAPQLPASPDLAIVLPAGSKWLIGERYVRLADDLTIDGVPDSSVVYGFLSIDEGSGLPTVTNEHWYSSFPVGSELAALRAAGLPCLGLVTTDTDAVTAIDSTADTGKADLIYTQAGILALIESMGGGGGGVSQGAFDALQNQVNALIERIVALENANGGSTTEPAQSESEREAARNAKLSCYISELSPQWSTETDESQDIPGVIGGGELFSGVPTEVVSGGNATRDPATHSVHG